MTPLKMIVLSVAALFIVIPSPLPLLARVPLLAALLVGGVIWVYYETRPDKGELTDEPLPWEDTAGSDEQKKE
ncbi:MAG: hypothetical protein HC893_02145 [Chloroflexaceae bacterium]|nr:hypothetical protein [Chloroflexaceae bacterium]NJL32861.1 hypothetical protein [Chloroflexaceae bacterium]NJO06983.1 hypothetical protein [Chloroflexaceae bacterium]